MRWTALLSAASLPCGLLAAQVPLRSPLASGAISKMNKQNWKQAANSFSWKEAADIFSPKDLVGLGRPGAGVANVAGDLVLVPFSKYDFDEKKNKKSIFLAPIESTVKPLEIPLAKGGEAFWLDTRTVGHVVEGENSTLEFYAIDVQFEAESTLSTPKSPVLIGSFPSTGATNFIYNPASRHLVFSAEVYDDGDLTTVVQQDKEWEERGTTAFVYDETYVRHWDTYVGPKISALFSAPLSRTPDREWAFEQKWTNILKGTGHSSPVAPFGGTDDFDVSKTHVVYTSKDPVLPEAWHTKQNVYIVPVTGDSEPKELTCGKQGATHSPVFSTDGTKVAWLELGEDGYEADAFRIVLYDLSKDVRFTITDHWDRSPDALAFSKDDKTLYFSAGDEAKVKVFSMPVPPTPLSDETDYAKPLALTSSGAASGVQPLIGGRVLFSRSSFVSPNDVFVLSGIEESNADATLAKPPTVTQLTNFTAADLAEKHMSGGEEFWFKGALDRDVQGWILTPKGFKKGDEAAWPVVLLIHGGPQGAWEDQWSTRWNPNVFVNQGFVVVMINPTGSTTFGQDFTDAIKMDWGGKPFVDLKKGWDYILGEYPEVDADRAVAAGASWGGFAINYIQGHPEFGFGFKALVCHDGVFDAAYLGYSTDELFFFNHEWGGRPWDKHTKEVLDKFSPSLFVDKWSTPQLTIHGSKDFRLPETDGIAVFHTLQQRGVPSRLVIFPDENHWVLDHGNSLKWHYEVFRWFDQWVGMKAQ
ncbi:Alpha/Beta hydrolase protein [Schizophyllum amplum]|uniref:Dipeptidyl-peptidase V n=1 Tax=Schizophyllum amplum TaxID=97359 RepID=A0A550C6V3_9AGAR|nr:Alpha/Beta hydrolase protein [Auriculariopsis ampla]